MDSNLLQPPDISSWQNLNTRVKSVWLVRASILWLVLIISMAGVDYVATSEANGWPLPRGVAGASIGILLFFVSIFMVRASYKRYRYFVGVDDLAVQHGVFWTTCRYVSRGRIQHVDVSSGPIERMLGLSQISVHVAGGMHSAVSIPGITPDEAEALRVRLMHGVVPIGSEEDNNGISPS